METQTERWKKGPKRQIQAKNRRTYMYRQDPDMVTEERTDER